MTGDATTVGAGSRYRGVDRRRPDDQDLAWRKTSVGLLASAAVMAALLRRPADLDASALHEDMLLAVTAALAAATAAALLIHHAIGSRSYELLSGWALAALSIGHLALVKRRVGADALLGDAAGAAIFFACHGLAVVCFAARLVVPPIEPWSRRLVVSSTAVAALVAAGLAATGIGRYQLEALARPKPDGPLAASLLLGGMWIVLVVGAGCRRGRVARVWTDPLTVVLAGSALAVLAPALVDLTDGDPGRARLMLAFGTSLCALAMSGEALWYLLRGQHARLLAAEVERVVADQALEVERAARSELDHDLAAALLAVEGAARALERRERGDPRSSIDHRALAQAIASEISRLQHLLGRVDHRAVADQFAIGPALLPVITCDLAQGVDIRTEIPPGLTARGSPLATAQVVRNLLDNAHRHAPGAPVRISAGQHGPWVYVRVEDDGPGVPAAASERIFARGVQGDVADCGSGLGLFVASRLMEEQSGDLVLEDADTAAFRLRLPAVEGSRHG